MVYPASLLFDGEAYTSAIRWRDLRGYWSRVKAALGEHCVSDTLGKIGHRGNKR